MTKLFNIAFFSFLIFQSSNLFAIDYKTEIDDSRVDRIPTDQDIDSDLDYSELKIEREINTDDVVQEINRVEPPEMDFGHEAPEYQYSEDEYAELADEAEYDYYPEEEENNDY